MATLQDASGTIAAVEVLTEATASQYTLADVVLPMPGFKIEYPPNLRADVRPAAAGSQAHGHRGVSADVIRWWTGV